MNREKTEMMQVSYESDGVTRLNGRPLRRQGKSDRSGTPSFLRRVLMSFALVALMVAALFTKSKSFLPNDPSAAYVPAVGGGANTDDSDGTSASIEEALDREMDNYIQMQDAVLIHDGDSSDVKGAAGKLGNF